MRYQEVEKATRHHTERESMEGTNRILRRNMFNPQQPRLSASRVNSFDEDSETASTWEKDTPRIVTPVKDDNMEFGNGVAGS